MLATVFDLDDLCDRWDPWDELMALKSRVPDLKVTLFAIPALCSDELLEKYRALDWVELAIHGYHHSTYECVIWGKQEALDKISEGLGMGLVPGFKAPGWIHNEKVLEAARELGVWVADNKYHCELDPEEPYVQYVYNRRDDVVGAHGHTWDTMDNGPSVWVDWFDGTEEFKFVSEVVKSTDDVRGESFYYKVADQIDIKPGDIFMDVGAYRGEEIAALEGTGARVVSYEPHPDYYQRLAQKFGDRSEIHFAAISTHSNGAKLSLVNEDSYNSGPTLDPRKRTASKDTIKVPTLDLAEEIRRLGNVKVLKIDIEGHEYDVLDHILKDGAVRQVEQIWVEDHSRVFDDPKWHAKRESVLAAYEEAGIKIGDWI